MTKLRILSDSQLEMLMKVEKALAVLDLQYAIKLPNGDGTVTVDFNCGL